MKIYKFFSIVIISILFWQCELNVDGVDVSAKEVDFSSYVALGDNFTAGFYNGALGQKGQVNSYPNIIATQIKSAGVSLDFVQPLINSDKSIGTTVINAQGALNGYFSLMVVNNALTPVPSVGDATLLSTSVAVNGPFNNLGIPGAKSMHLLASGYGNPNLGAGKFNPFFTRLASNPVSSSIIGEAMASSPKFFSLWIGTNDVLVYALAGGEADAITVTANFKVYIEMLLDNLTSVAPQGVIANIPDVTEFAYFNAVKYNALALPEANANALNAAYAQYNVAANAAGLSLIYFQEGNNPFIIEDATLTALPASIRFRQIKADEKILLSIPQDSIKQKGWGSQKPIPAKYVLTTPEIESIKSAVNQYNIDILALATQKGLAHVNLNQFFNKLNQGFMFDGMSYSKEFVRGNFYSLDGINPTLRGNAMVANEFIKAINNQYKCVIPLAAANGFEGIVFP